MIFINIIIHIGIVHQLILSEIIRENVEIGIVCRYVFLWWFIMWCEGGRTSHCNQFECIMGYMISIDFLYLKYWKIVILCISDPVIHHSVRSYT